MKLLKLDEESLSALMKLEEAGIDYWVVSARIGGASGTNHFAIRSNGKALLYEPIEEYYSLANLLNGDRLPEDESTVQLNALTVVSQAIYRVILPNGYMPAYGAHPLLGSTTLSSPTQFYRYTSLPNDPRFNSGSLSKGTYLTSFNDQQLVTSGFGAVSRYALPLPIPASYKHAYTLPAGTKLSVGTVAPLFGQSGGGVEVMTTSSVSGVAQNSTSPISDY